MTEKRYALTVSIFLGASALLMLFSFILVAHHKDVPDRIQQLRSAAPATGSGAPLRIGSIGPVSVATPATAAAPIAATAVAAPSSRDGLQVYQAACAVCHGAGIAGAPKLGDKAQWAGRIAKGTDPLYASAVNGVQGSAGVMPPKGGNTALSDAEVKGAVDYMVSQSR